MPYLLQMLQWAIAGFRGGSTIEGVLDQMVLSATQAAQQAAMTPPPPDPALQVAQVKAQAEQGKAQMGIQQARVQTQADLIKMAMDVKAHQQKTGIDLLKAHQESVQSEKEHEQTMQQLEAQMRNDALKEKPNA
jgi:hypothetical protein